MIALLIAPIAFLRSIWSRVSDASPSFRRRQIISGGVIMLIAGLLIGEASSHAYAERHPVIPYLIPGSIIGFTAYVWLLHPCVPAPQLAYVNPCRVMSARGVGERFTAPISLPCWGSCSGGRDHSGQRAWRSGCTVVNMTRAVDRAACGRRRFLLDRADALYGSAQDRAVVAARAPHRRIACWWSAGCAEAGPAWLRLPWLNRVWHGCGLTAC